MRPGESVVAVSNHLERLVPSIIIASDHRADPEQHKKEALVEEHPVGGNRIHLHPPRFRAIGSPAGNVVVTEKLRRDKQAIEVGIVGAARIVAELGQLIRR